ncbi:MAG: hypothetical protein QOI57_3236 [Rubrobacteraceae bacterium]|nr:hypothetical protein [Rubrobacteraceae bacterium]
MAKVIERAEAHYEVQEVEFGRVYQWQPKSVLIECECGEINTLTASQTTCEECGAEHTGLVREDLVDGQLEVGDEVAHPWRYLEGSEDNTVLPY